MSENEVFCEEEVPSDDDEDEGLDPETLQDLRDAEVMAQACDVSLLNCALNAERLSSSLDEKLPDENGTCFSCSSASCNLHFEADTSQIVGPDISPSASVTHSESCFTANGSTSPVNTAFVNGKRKESESSLNERDFNSIPSSGHMPKDVVKSLNDAWVEAGYVTPSDVTLHELAAIFGLTDATRFRKFFKGKEDRERRKCRREGQKESVLDFGDSLVERLESRIFGHIRADHEPSLIAEALYYVSHLERIGPILDAGIKVVRALNTKAGQHAVLTFLNAYWARVRLHFLEPTFKGCSESASRARLRASICLEISMRLHFRPSYAMSLFSTSCLSIANAAGEPGLHKRQCLSVSKRLMTRVNMRLRDALLLEH